MYVATTVNSEEAYMHKRGEVVLQTLLKSEKFHNLPDLSYQLSVLAHLQILKWDCTIPEGAEKAQQWITSQSSAI